MLEITDPFVQQHWDIRECSLHNNTEGGVSLVDHSIQSTVVSGTIPEVYEFCKNNSATRADLQQLFGLDMYDLEAGIFNPAEDLIDQKLRHDWDTLSLQQDYWDS